MGGQAFTNLKTDTKIEVPRLSSEIYRQVVADITPKLELVFNRVTIPREGPNKPDFGDIDFLVEGIRNPEKADIWGTVKALLGAVYYVPSHHFAVPYPSIPDAYVQIDVELSPGSGTKDGPELFEWTRFMKSDSDLLQIIGVIHRSLGLTCNDKGLHVRVEEVQAYNRKKSMIFLTRDPDKAMEFYGYDKAKYHEGFRNEAELFDWATNGRWFYWKVYEDREDRSRMEKRAMFRSFVHDYIPQCGKGIITHNEEESELDTKATSSRRKEVLEEALRTFDKHRTYQAVMTEHNTQGIEEGLWLRINNSIPLEDPSRGTTLKGLKRWVAFENGQPYITKEPISGSKKLRWTEHISEDAVSDVLLWVVENREKVWKLEEDRTVQVKRTAMKA